MLSNGNLCHRYLELDHRYQTKSLICMQTTRAMKQVDSCWSWVICLVAFINHALTCGFSFSIGVYYVEFLSVFEKNKGTTALLSSINVGVFMATGN